MKLIDFSDPFFAPVWIRICVVAVCLIWGGFELMNAQTGWAIGFIVFGVFAAWRFTVNSYDADEEG